MKLKVLGLLCEAGPIKSKLGGEFEAAYAQFEIDFKKETGISASKADIKTIKNSRAFKKMTNYLNRPEEKVDPYDDYKYTDSYDGGFSRFY